MPAKAEELTPSQQYRLMLNSLSDHERLIMRLENRWKKSIDKWIRASVKAQSVYRMHQAQRVAMGLRGKARVLKMKLNLIAKAQDHFRWKKWDECMKTAQEVLALEAENVEMRRLRGHCELGQGKHRAAVEEYSLGLAVDADHIEIRQARVRCHTILQDYPSAFEDFNHLMEIDCEESSYWHMRGLLHGKLNMWEEAAADFEHVVALGNTDPVDYIRRGMAQASSQRWESAIKSFSEALKREERNVTALVLRGRVYCCYRKWGEAEADFNEALRWDPHSEEAAAGLEVVHIPHLPLPITDGIAPAETSSSASLGDRSRNSAAAADPAAC